MPSKETWYALGWVAAAVLMWGHLLGTWLAGWDASHWTYWAALAALLANAALTAAEYHGIVS